MDKTIDPTKPQLLSVEVLYRSKLSQNAQQVLNVGHCNRNNDVCQVQQQQLGSRRGYVRKK
jgi:hypothetical protein